MSKVQNDVKPQRVEKVKQPLDCRVMPKFIMYDGEGNFQKKIINDHRNKGEQIEFTWAKSLDTMGVPISFEKIGSRTLANHVEDIYKSDSTSSLPQICFNRRAALDLEEKMELRPSISKQHLVKYGKYSLRYNEKSDIFRLKDDVRKSNIHSGYNANSGTYGQFYYENDSRPKFSGQLSPVIPEDFITPAHQNYRVYEVEKPILTYHSLKSYLFQNAKR